MPHNYTLQDIVGTLESIFVFSIFLFAPGYCFGLASNVLGFRGRSDTEKVLLSLPLSLVLSTVVMNLVGRVVPADILLFFFLVAAVGVLVYLTRRWLRRSRDRKMQGTTKIVLALGILWAIVVVALLVDIQLGGRLYVNTAIWDHADRVAFVRSALRSGPPLKNPFFYIGSAPVARYYYYWYFLCSYPARLAHIDARYVLYGSSVWAGFCLAAIIPIYLKDFFGTTKNLRRKSIFGILLLSVTGLDLIPTAYEFLRARSVFPDMEWWNPVQITSWMDALLWVPHHVASLVACFIGFLALWSVRKDAGVVAVTRNARIVACMFAAGAFAAAAGLSVYVTFTFAIFLCCWGLRFLYKRSFADFLLYLSTGCLSVLISLPYLHDLLSPGTTDGTAAAGNAAGAIQFGLRQLPSFLSTPYFLRIRGISYPHLLYPFGLVVVYLLEFGFFAIVGWARLRRDLQDRSKLKEAEVASWYLVAVSLCVITFIRSSVISNNDLAYRSAMIAQFVLLLWGAEYVDRWFDLGFDPARLRMTLPLTARNGLIVATLILGLAGSVYGLAIERVYTLLEDRGSIAHPANWLPMPPGLGQKMFETRVAYRQLGHLLPVDSIVQYNPMASDDLALLMYSKFQSVDAFPDCGADFGGSRSDCLPVQAVLTSLFNTAGTYNIHPICEKLSIDALVAHASDPAWKDRGSWVWSNQPVIENPYIRIFKCK